MAGTPDRTTEEMLARLVELQEEALRNQRAMMLEQAKAIEFSRAAQAKARKSLIVFAVVIIGLLVIPWLLNAGLAALVAARG